MPENKTEWHYLEDGKFPENYKRVLITVLDDEGKRVVVSGMFVTSGSPGECSKPIAWMPFPEPCGARK